MIVILTAQIGLAIRTHWIDQYKMYDNYIWGTSACKTFAGLITHHSKHSFPPPSCRLCMTIKPTYNGILIINEADNLHISELFKVYPTQHHPLNPNEGEM